MSAAAAPEPLDFHRFHRDELPPLLRAGRGANAASGARALGSLAFRLPDGDAYTYVPTAAGMDVVAGDAAADTVIELAPELWQNLVRELDAAAGLLYGGRAKCLRGSALRWVAWEPALRAMWSGRPVYRASEAQLLDRRGAPLDPASTFTLDSEREDMAHFLRSAGYLFVRGVFTAGEIAAFRAEAEALAGEAKKGDKLSWWGKNAAGEEVLTRVTRAAAKPGLRALPHDPRLVALKDLADEKLAHRVPPSADEGVSVIWKRPRMSEGLGDLPWHRDCGMGGHAVMCPTLIASVFLTPATPETGELRMLPASWKCGCGPIDARHPHAPRGVSFAAAPGDVSLHYGDTMHAAPPPTRDDLDTYRISAVTGYARAGARAHRGRYYNEVLHRREDGQIEHLAKIAADADES
jgi:ectoine hydroxylase-related dioxygenase (phytanoyl-CoA dioxygenase family)